jgi:hypothetical protein
MQRIAGLVDRQRHHIELNIRTATNGMFGAGRTADLPRPDRQRPAAREQPLGAHSCNCDGVSDLIVERDRPLEPDNDACLIMILQIAPDLGRVRDDGNPAFAQQIGRSDSGKLQQLRRLQRAG